MTEEDDRGRPAVSVILTAYNRATYVHNALQSILEQTIDPNLVEIVVVTNLKDLGSHESTLPVTGSRGNQIRIVTPGDVPVGPALVAGIRASSAPVLAFLDDDDLWEPGRLASIVEEFESHSDVSYYHNRQSFIGPDGSSALATFAYQLFKHPSDLFFNSRLHLGADALLTSTAELINREAGFNMSSIALRRRVIEPWLGLLSRLDGLQDQFLLYAALLANSGIVLDSKKSTRYRLHSENASFHALRTGGDRQTRAVSLSRKHLENLRVIRDGFERSQSKRLLQIVRVDELYFSLVAGIQSPKISRKDVAQSILLFIRYSVAIRCWKNLVVIARSALRLLWPGLSSLGLAT